jgi:hypothetical protein
VKDNDKCGEEREWRKANSGFMMCLVVEEEGEVVSTLRLRFISSNGDCFNLQLRQIEVVWCDVTASLTTYGIFVDRVNGCGLWSLSRGSKSQRLGIKFSFVLCEAKEKAPTFPSIHPGTLFYFFFVRDCICTERIPQRLRSSALFFGPNPHINKSAR